MDESPSAGPPRRSVWRAWGAAALPTLLLCAADLATGPGAREPSAWALGALFSLGFAGLAAVPLTRLGAGPALVWAPVVLVSVAYAGTLMAALHRAAELFRATRDLVDLLAVALLAAASVRLLRRRGWLVRLRPSVRGLVALTAAAAVVAGASTLAPTAWHGVRGAVVIVLAAGALVWLSAPRRSAWWLAAAAGLGAWVLSRIDPVYEHERGWLGCVVLLLAVSAAMRVLFRRAKHGVAPPRLLEGAWVAALASLLLLGGALGGAEGGAGLGGAEGGAGLGGGEGGAGLGGGEGGAGLSAAEGRGVLRVLVGLLRRASDADGDGHGVLFGQRDCAPADARVHPGAHEVPGNGLDDNCLAGDAPEPRGAAPTAWAGAAVNPRPEPSDRGDGRRPDVLLVVVDTLRADTALLPTMRSFRRLEREGVRFDRAYATASFTVQSMLGVLTGVLAPSTEYEWATSHDASPLRVPTTLLERLRDAQFDVGVAGVVGRAFETARLVRGARVVKPTVMDADAPRTNTLARAAWDALDPARPRFLYVHYMDVHAYEWDHGVDKREAYRQRAERTDRALGELLDMVGPSAAVVVLADHGESFGLHGLRGHSTSLFEEVMRVPLYVRAPGVTPRVDAHVTSLLAVAPTVLALAGAPALPARGAYLCVGGEGCADMDAPMALEHGPVHLHGLLRGRAHVIHDLATGQRRAFDLARDPDERHPEAPSASLRAGLVAWEETGMAPFRSAGPLGDLGLGRLGQAPASR